MDLTVDQPGQRLWASDDAAEPATAPHAHDYPPPGWPTKDQITYTKEAITTLFLLVAVPVVILQLLRRPSSAARGIAGKAAGI